MAKKKTKKFMERMAANQAHVEQDRLDRGLTREDVINIVNSTIVIDPKTGEGKLQINGDGSRILQDEDFVEPCDIDFDQFDAPSEVYKTICGTEVVMPDDSRISKDDYITANGQEAFDALKQGTFLKLMTMQERIDREQKRRNEDEAKKAEAEKAAE